MTSLTAFKGLRRQEGFTLIELLMVIVLIGVLSVLSISLVNDSLNESRFDATVSKLKSIRDAIVGDPSLKQGDLRSSFGFLGDIGAIPTNPQGIAALLSNPSLPAWAIDASSRIGLGWNGPYLGGGLAGSDYLKDAWGYDLMYDSTTSPPYIKSLGADNAPNGSGFNQDIIVTIPAELIKAKVYGFISNGGSPYTLTADIEINYPGGSGALSTTTASIGAVDKGYFSFSNIPLGVRSVTVYTPSKASATKTLGPIPITVDSPNFLVPPSKLDLNLICGAGYVTYAGSKSFSNGNKTMNFQVNYLSNLTLTKMAVDFVTATTFNSFTTQGLSYGNTLPMDFSPNPASTLQQITFNDTLLNVTSANNVDTNIIFGADVSAEVNTKIYIYHNLGCDTVIVP